MSTVGYGDVTPKQWPEIIFVIFMTLVSSAVFAYTINTIGSIFSEKAQKIQSFRKKKYDLQNFLNQRNISKQIEIKMLRYLEYVENQDLDNHMLGDNPIALISQSLKNEFNLEYYGNILKTSKIFKLNFSQLFIDALALQGIQEQTLAPDEILFKSNAMEDKLYFVASGIIQVYIEKNQDVLEVNKLQRGTLLGYEQFFGNLPSEFSAKAYEISKVIYCSKQNFLRIIQNYPQDYEIFCYLRDQLTLSNKKIDVKCTSCGQYNHSFKECPLIHLSFNKFILKGKYSKYTPQLVRLNLKRKNRIKNNSLIINNIVRNKQRLFKLILIGQIDSDYKQYSIEEYLNQANDIEFQGIMPQIEFTKNEWKIITNSQLQVLEYENDVLNENDSIKKEDKSKMMESTSNYKIDNNNKKQSYNETEQLNHSKKSFSSIDEVNNLPDIQSLQHVDCKIEPSQNPELLQGKQINNLVEEQTQQSIILTNKECEQSVQTVQKNKYETIFSSRLTKTSYANNTTHKNLKEQKHLFDYHFESQMNYTKYYPSFNFNKVIENYKKYTKLREKQLQILKKNRLSRQIQIKSTRNINIQFPE